MSEYQFTTDWFSWAPPLWTMLKEALPEGDSFANADYPVRNFLEIGSYEGRSTVWTVENMMRTGDTITCIDTWEGGEEHDGVDMVSVEMRFNHNTLQAEMKFPNRRVHKLKCDSVLALSEELQYAKGRYVFAYIDGSHIAKDVLTDACMVWPLVKQGGIVVFDDYLWGDPSNILHRPKLAIDSFVNIFSEELEVMHVGYQLVIKKK